MNLSLVDGEGTFCGKCFNWGKVYRYQTKECKKCIGEYQGGQTGESEGGNTNNDGSKKTCNFCGVKGHNEIQCFKKNPKRAPGWWKVKHNKTESNPI